MNTSHHRSRRARGSARLGGVLLAALLGVTACGGDASNETAPTANESDLRVPTSATETTDTAIAPRNTTTETTDTTIASAPSTSSTSPSTSPAPPETNAPPAASDTEPPGITAGCSTTSPGVSQFVVDAGGAEHDVRIHVPTTFDGDSPLPLVLNFHGFGSNGDQQATFTGYEDLSESEGFIVAHPTGVPATGDVTGRNSWELADIDDPAKDDLAFVDELLDLLIAEWCVDESRVYATGMSGGGLFTSRLVCDMSDRIAAAVSVAAIAYSESCDPSRAVPFIAIHGTDDQTVPFDGDLTGTRFETEPFARQLFSEPIADQFAQFAAVMGCELDGEQSPLSTDVLVTTYTGCDDDVPLRFYEVVGGGHSWPSSPLADLLVDLQGYTTFDIDATADGWAFFEQHTLDA